MPQTLVQRLKRVPYASTGFCGSLNLNAVVGTREHTTYSTQMPMFVHFSASNNLIVLIPKSLKSHRMKILTLHTLIFHLSVLLLLHPDSSACSSIIPCNLLLETFLTLKITVQKLSASIPSSIMCIACMLILSLMKQYDCD